MEPDFKLELAKVSSIAVWIRLSGLPIEYYNAKALQHIGKAIGNVLRIDTFTATESRGKFCKIVYPSRCGQAAYYYGDDR